MQAVILASGNNKRVQHLFPDLPKVMFPLGGKPYLKYWLEMLLPQKSEVIILVQYHARIIKEYLVETYPAELASGKIKIIDRPEYLGPVRTIAECGNILTGNFAIFYCDTLFNVDLAKAEQSLKNDSLGSTFLTADTFNMFERMEVLVDEPAHVVTSFEPDAYAHAEGLMDVGQIYKKEALGLFAQADEMAEHFNKVAWPKLIKEERLSYYKVGPVFDIGTEKNYNTTKEIFSREGLRALDEE